jgi:hypothetical protein
MFHHMRGFKSFEYDGEWDEYFEHYITGQTLHNSWFDHVRPWWEHRNDENVLFITFESMKEDLPGTVHRIAQFIGVTDLSEGEVEKIVQQSTFDAMKSDVKTNYAWEANRRHPDRPAFMRKGIVGLLVDCVVSSVTPCRRLAVVLQRGAVAAAGRAVRAGAWRVGAGVQVLCRLR